MAHGMTTDPARDGLRALNAEIARAYDAVPYDPPASPGLDPAEVLGMAARCGGAAAADPARADILDLDCGTGAQAERAARLTTGRVVGADLAPGAATAARARLAPFGARCEVICADFMDLDAHALGRFDLIYHVGVLYVTPPAVQDHLLTLIADTLKPGGVALISYYAGAVPLVMAGLHDVLHAAADPALPPAAQIGAARARLRDMAQALARQPGDHRLIAAILEQVRATPDTIFFHEMLNRSFRALSTAALEAALGPRGVHFLTWMRPAPLPHGLAPRARAAAADALVFGTGGYFYGVFQKDASSARPHQD